jgi:hypothetical protein
MQKRFSFGLTIVKRQTYGERIISGQFPFARVIEGLPFVWVFFPRPITALNSAPCGESRHLGVSRSGTLGYPFSYHNNVVTSFHTSRTALGNAARRGTQRPSVGRRHRRGRPPLLFGPVELSNFCADFGKGVPLSDQTRMSCPKTAVSINQKETV